MFLQNQNNSKRLSLMSLEDLQKCKLNVTLTSLLQLFFIFHFSYSNFYNLFPIPFVSKLYACSKFLITLCSDYETS